MKLTPFVLLYLTSCAANAQTSGAADAQTSPAPKKIEHYYTFQWKECDAAHSRFYSVAVLTDSGWHCRNYYVQGPTLQMDGWYEDSSFKIGNGNFVFAYPDKKIEMTGRYLHGKKEGLWITFHYNGTMSDSTVYSNGHAVGTSLGYYPNGMIRDSSVYQPDGSGVEVTWFSTGQPSSAGAMTAGRKKNGRWKFWHENGKFAAIELYSNDTLLEHQYFDENGQPEDTEQKDRKASFKGGNDAWLNWLNRKLPWPPNYQIVNGDEAAVVISGTVDESGTIIDVYVSTPFFPPFERTALDAIRRSPKWDPAIDHNRRVQFHFRQPVIFKQPSD